MFLIGAVTAARLRTEARPHLVDPRVDHTWDQREPAMQSDQVKSGMELTGIYLRWGQREFF